MQPNNPQQTIFTPLGIAKKPQNNDENSLLVTPYRIIGNTLFEYYNTFTTFTNIEDVNRHAKKANLSAYKHYIDEKMPECKNGLLKKLLMQHKKRSNLFEWEYNLNEIPIEVSQKYNQNIVKYKNKTLLNFARERFLTYIWKNEKNSKYLHCYNEIDPGEGLKKLQTRYSKEYCDKIKKRMAWLAANYKNSNCVFLTLTYDPKQFNNDKFVMWTTIKTDLHRFMQKARIKWIRDHGETVIVVNGETGRYRSKKIAYKGMQPFPKYIHAVEAQKNGNPHIHIVFLDSKRLMDWRDIITYWGKGAIYINRTKEGERVKNPVNYVTKYITKNFANPNFDNVRAQSLLWLFNMRSFDRSKGLIAPLNPPSSGDWQADYIITTERLNNDFVERDVINYKISLLFDPVTFAEPPPPPATGQYVISIDDEEIVSTDSPFWASFFNSDPG